MFTRHHALGDNSYLWSQFEITILKIATMNILKILYQHNRSRTKGFTLVELMIVIAIVAVLAAIATASYQQQILKARRAEAKTALSKTVTLLERRYTERGAYNTAADGTVPGDINDLLPDGYRNVPEGTSSDDRTYLISLTATANTFSLTAAAQNIQQKDKCGDLIITQANQRSCSSDDYSAAECLSECWQD